MTTLNLKKQASLTTVKLAKTAALTGFVASVMFSAKPAQAAVFNYYGTDYDITTVTGTFDSLQTQLQATPWWGEPAASSSFAAFVGDGLSTPNSINGFPRGPLFASSESFSFVSSSSWYPGVILSSPPGVGGVSVFSNVSYTWAVASTPTAVPEPLTILGAATSP